MSAQTDRLEAIGIVNPHGYANVFDGGAVWLDYVAYDNRIRRTSGWRVRRNGYRTDPEHQPSGGNYADRGVKVFANFEHGGTRATALAAAQEWAGARYGITEWKRTPFGTYMAAWQVDVLAKRVGAVRAARADAVTRVRERLARPHLLTEYGTTDCPVQQVRAFADDGTCSACGAPVQP